MIYFLHTNYVTMNESTLLTLNWWITMYIVDSLTSLQAATEQSLIAHAPSSGQKGHGLLRLTWKFKNEIKVILHF